MKYCLIIFLFFAGATCSQAQDSTVHLSASMFDEIQGMGLNLLDGWRFHPGNNPAWANPGVNTIGWQRMKPSDVSKKMADKNGRIEGWFRLTILLDSSFANIPLYLGINERQASDTYIDGNLFESYGNTGINGKAFKTPERNFKPDLSPIQLPPGKEHVVAIHFVNYVPSFPLNLIESEAGTYPLWPILSGPALMQNLNAYYDESGIYQIVSITVCFVLLLLFWLLAFQNPREANLRLIALCTTFFGMFGLLIYIQFHGKFSLAGIITITALLDLSAVLMVLVILIILAKIFTNKVPRKLLIFLCVISVVAFYSLLKPYNIPLFIITVIWVAVTLYYLVSSWKTLKGAQWAIAAGVVLTLLWAVIWAVSQFFVQGIPVISYREVVLAGINISFPLSLLVYVSFRFREIIKEVRENARWVVQVTEEKKQQALNQQKALEEEVKKQTADLRDTLENLRSTQAQLIQSEKMASLGELTAGIAHEIQNPLNFVNNFSEVNNELIEEMNEENDIEEIKAIANDIKQNNEKIFFHGKRADAIVKGMLQHSRKNTGQKELTDINALCDEYLRLSYHGLRAKDKSFNADFKTDFDESIGKINIVPQDIGRVLLNLFNNAFYAVNEKAKLSANSQQ